jgi:hypothetical protein
VTLVLITAIVRRRKDISACGFFHRLVEYCKERNEDAGVAKESAVCRRLDARKTAAVNVSLLFDYMLHDDKDLRFYESCDQINKHAVAFVTSRACTFG